VNKLAKEHNLNKWCKLFLKAATRQDVLVISSHGGQVDGAAGWKPAGVWKPTFYTDSHHGAATYGSIPDWFKRYEQDALTAYDTGSAERVGTSPGDYSLTKFQAPHKGRSKDDGRSDEGYADILADVGKTGNDFDVLTIRNKDSKKPAIKLSEVYTFLNNGTVGGHDLKYPKIICAFCLVSANYGGYVHMLTGKPYTG
jgi:hypothetical protein